MHRSRTSPLDIADAAFRAAATGRPPLVLDGAAVGHGLPPRDVPLDELKRILLAPSTAYAARDAAVAALLRRTRSADEGWILGLTRVLLPGLCRMAGRLIRHYPGDPTVSTPRCWRGSSTASSHGTVVPAQGSPPGCCGRRTGAAVSCGRRRSPSPRTAPRARSRRPRPGVPIIPTWFSPAPRVPVSSPQPRRS